MKTINDSISLDPNIKKEALLLLQNIQKTAATTPNLSR
jgi:hypothetical protein